MVRSVRPGTVCRSVHDATAAAAAAPPAHAPTTPRSAQDQRPDECFAHVGPPPARGFTILSAHSAASLKRIPTPMLASAQTHRRIRTAATATRSRSRSSCSSRRPLRLWQLSTPADLMFDEIYYAKDAKAIVDGRVGTHGPYRWAAGDEVSWPHPEMGKFAIAAGILAVRRPLVRLAPPGGDRRHRPARLRLPARAPARSLASLGASWPCSSPAADPLGIAQSRIATLDIFIAVWTVLCILLRPALRAGRLAHALALRCAAPPAAWPSRTKWSGGLAIVAAALIIVVAWALQRRAASAAAAAEADDGSPAPAAADAVEPAAAAAARRGRPGAAPQGSAGRRIALVVAALRRRAHRRLPAQLHAVLPRTATRWPTSSSCTGRW